MPRTALIAVDVQPDFIDGSLGGVGRDQVVAPLQELAKDVDVVIATRDWHPETHISFSDDPQFTDKSWPKHCVQDTEGAEIVKPIKEITDYTVSKGTDPNEEQYSGWEGRSEETGETLHDILEEEGIETVIVGGLCTDYCVLNTALDIRRNGWDVEVPLTAIAGVAQESSEKAIEQMREAGISITQ